MASSHDNPWGAMDEADRSPWEDVPSRTLSNTNESKAADGSAQTTEQPKSTALEHSSPASSSGVKPAPSKSRGPRRYGNLAQSTTLETLDDSMGPLGPLGMEAPEEPVAPAPPVKEIVSRSRTSTAASRPSTASSARTAEDVDDASSSLNGARIPPPVQPASDSRSRQPHPSQPLEQAAKPTFNITVGDPHTVGNAANSHTVYSVITRTTSKAYNHSSFTVTRRYRDFLWLYERMHDNNPGVVVPPPPEKQAVGRFDINFIESRRMALERMMNKMAAHHILQHDGDLKTFLESEAFNVDIKHKDRAKDPLATESKGTGFMASVGLGSSSGGGKFIEHDDWFHDRRIYLDALENQLRALQKSTDTVVAQRKALAESCGDFSTSLHALAGVELSPSLSGPLDALGALQLRIQELYSRQALQDVLTLGIVIDEYLRLIGSVQKAFTQRQRAFHAWHSAESKLVEIKKTQEKLLRAGRSQQERIGQVQADVADQERKVHSARLLFEDMGRLMRNELEKFEREKVEDFKSGVETFLEGAVEAQKELIELWETYLLQLDAEEDGPPLMPAGIAADQAADQAAGQAALSQHLNQNPNQASDQPKSEAQLRREEARDRLQAEAPADDSTFLEREGEGEGEGELDTEATPSLISGTTGVDGTEIETPRVSEDSVGVGEGRGV